MHTTIRLIVCALVLSFAAQGCDNNKSASERWTLIYKAMSPNGPVSFFVSRGIPIGKTTVRFQTKEEYSDGTKRISVIEENCYGNSIKTISVTKYDSNGVIVEKRDSPRNDYHGISQKLIDDVACAALMGR